MEDIIKHTGDDSLNNLNALVNKLSIDEATHRNEIEELKCEIRNLKQKVKTLEEINFSLLKERNIQLVKEYSGQIIMLIDTGDYDGFIHLLEQHDYPLDEFFHSETGIDFMNPLHRAIEMQKEDIAEVLISKGADVNIPDKKDQWTPLMFAIQNKNFELVKLIIEHSGQVNYKDIVSGLLNYIFSFIQDGFTPLSVAVDTQNKDIIKFLLSYKPKIDSGKEILAIAEPYENPEIQKMLQDYFESRGLD